MISNNYIRARQFTTVLDCIVLCVAFFMAAFLRREVLYLFLSGESFVTSWSQSILVFFYQKTEYSFRQLEGIIPLDLNFSLMILIVGIWLVSLKIVGAYDRQVIFSIEPQYLIIGKAALYATLGLMTFGFLFVYSVPSFPRTMAILYPMCAYVLLIVGRVIVRGLIKRRNSSDVGRRAIIIVGSGDLPSELITDIQKHPEWGLNVLGFVGLEKEEDLSSCPTLGDISELDVILHSHQVDAVAFAVPTARIESVEKAIELCELEGVETHIVSDFFKRIIAKIHVDDTYDLPILTLSTATSNSWQMMVKRTSDILVSGVMLLLLAPLLFIISVLVSLSSPGPILYRWHVVGYNKRDFVGYKFRTMYTDADSMREKLTDMNEMEGPVFKIAHDPRVTKIGRYLRKYSLDELPQLYSVLKGDMSLVGPRPGGAWEVPEYDNWHRRKLSVKPGITCLWQIRGRNEICSFDEWVRMDLEYIDNWSLWLDFKILLKTIPIVFSARGAS